jgi:hypothetical protein
VGRCYAKFGSTLEELAGSMLSDRIVAGVLGMEIAAVREYRTQRRGRDRDRSESEGTVDLARASKMLLRALRSHPEPVEMEGHMMGLAVSLRMDAGA